MIEMHYYHIVTEIEIVMFFHEEHDTNAFFMIISMPSPIETVSNPKHDEQ